MRVRCDSATDSGVAMTLGVYDDAQHKPVLSKKIMVRDIRGTEYTTIDLGTLALSEQTYAWAAPVVREKDEVEAVYIDRVVFVRVE